MALKILVGILVAVLVGGIAYGFYRAIPPTATQTGAMATSTTMQTITIGSATIQAEVEDTDASREQGLSGRTSLADGAGMLFIFDAPGKYGFWMKDMNFNIDMVFITASGMVATIAADASPEGYRRDPSHVFYPAEDVQDVLELPAGYAAAHDIAVGSQVTFNK